MSPGREYCRGKRMSVPPPRRAECLLSTISEANAHPSLDNDINPCAADNGFDLCLFGLWHSELVECLLEIVEKGLPLGRREECRHGCDRDDGCRAFTYNLARGVCFLKRAANQWTNFNAWAITGIKLTSLQANESVTQATGCSTSRARSSAATASAAPDT